MGTCLPRDQPLTVRRAKRRKGKVVTVIEGLDGVASNLPGILKQLKSLCAAGGTIDTAAGAIEIQGEHREPIATVLAEMGYPVKVAGG